MPAREGLRREGRAAPNSSSSVLTRTTPACSSSASTRDVGSRERSRVRARGRAPPSAVRPPSRHDGLLARTRAARSRNLRGLPKLSTYKGRRASSRVVLPVLEQIVGRNVGLVADAHEVAHADAERRARSRARRGPARPTATGTPPARRRHERRERRVEADGVVGVEHAEAVGPDHAHAERAHAIAKRVVCSAAPAAPDSA